MTARRWIALAAVCLLSMVGIWLFNVSRPGTVRGCPKGCSNEIGRRPGPLRVLSLNVLHGRPDFENLRLRMDLIADEIIARDADIVLLQEVPWVPGMGEVAAYLAERCGYNYLYLRSNGNRWAIFFEEGSAILSRYELRNPSFAELRPRAALFEHRVVLYAAAVTDWGDIDVFVTHLTDGEPGINLAQASSLQAFVEAVRNAPAVVGGDFNAEEGTTQIMSLASAWIDAFATANPHDPGLTCCIDDLHAGPSEALEKRIDYAFLLPQAGSETRVIRAEIILDQPVRMNGGWQWASDHVGLLIEIEIQR